MVKKKKTMKRLGRGGGLCFLVGSLLVIMTLLHSSGVEGPTYTEPLFLRQGSENQVGADGSIISIFLKLLSDKKTAIVKKIWYKTGSQWPGEFSHLGDQK